MRSETILFNDKVLDVNYIIQDNIINIISILDEADNLLDNLNLEEVKQVLSKRIKDAYESDSYEIYWLASGFGENDE